MWESFDIIRGQLFCVDTVLLGYPHPVAVPGKTVGKYGGLEQLSTHCLTLTKPGVPQTAPSVSLCELIPLHPAGYLTAAFATSYSTMLVFWESYCPHFWCCLYFCITWQFYYFPGYFIQLLMAKLDHILINLKEFGGFRYPKKFTLLERWCYELAVELQADLNIKGGQSWKPSLIKESKCNNFI